MSSTKLTIGLITYNGAKTLRDSVDSLLNQTFTDFVLLIYDNASEDQTSEICEEYQSQDSRVRHVRHSNTVSQSENFRSVLLAAKSAYFMWATDDDIWRPHFAEHCISVLETRPAAVCACAQIAYIKSSGEALFSRSTHSIKGTSLERLKTFLHHPRDNGRLYGVYRTEVLQDAYSADLTAFGYDWAVVARTLEAGEHIGISRVGLFRSYNEPGKYFAKFDRHFTRIKGALGLFSRVLPMLPLTVQLWQHTRPQIRWHLLGALTRMNIHQSLIKLRWKYPRFEASFRAFRKLDQIIFKSEKPTSG